MYPLESQPRTAGNRRGRLLGAIALGAAVTISLAACGGTSGSGSAIGTGSANGKAGYGMTGFTGSKVGGTTLTVGELNKPDSFNPAQIGPTADFTELTYESLTYLDQDGKVQPALAKSWQYVGTGNTKFQMTLRSDAVFSDGTKVTPEAVVASLKYTQATPGQVSSDLAGDTFSVTGSDTFEVDLQQANPVLPQLFSQVFGAGAIISPAGLANPSNMDAGHTSFGAGRYVYQPSQSVDGDHYTYTANPKFYDQSQINFKTVVMKVVSNAQSMVNAVKAGQIDVAKGDYTGIDGAVASGLQAVGGPTNSLLMVLTDRNGEKVKALADVRVRQALNYAIDRTAITKALLGKYGVPTTQIAMPGGDGYSADAAKKYPYDVNKAKQLLKAAGYSSGLTIDVATAPFAGFNDLGEALQAQLAKVGVTLKLTEATDGGGYMKNISSTSFPAFVGGQSALPMYLMGQQLFMASPNENPFKTTTPELTKLYNNAAAADTTERTALDKQITDYLVDNAWFVSVSSSPIVYFGAKTIGGMKLSANNTQQSPLDWYRIK